MKLIIKPICIIFLILVNAFLFDGFKLHAQQIKTPSNNEASKELNSLFDNGPFITNPGGGPEGTNLSVLQDVTLDMNYTGFEAGLTSNNRVSDDFVVPEHWKVSIIEFFVYQSGSTTNSTINHLNMKIWNGPPNEAESVIIWGDDCTNIISNTTWTNSYRVPESLPTETNMPIMSVSAEVPDLVLNPGIYWIDVQFDGVLDSGLWVVPITIIDSISSGNGLQSNNGIWTEIMDIGQQGIPFIVRGEVLVCVPPTNLYAEYVYHNYYDCGVELSWDGIEGEDSWIFYDNGQNLDEIGGPDSFSWAIKFDPEQLTNFDGASLSKIKIYNHTWVDNELRIYEGADAATLLHTQTLNDLAYGRWSEIELTNPVSIDITKQLWITVYTEDGDNSPACCGHNMNEPNGDLINLNGSTWEHLSDYNLDYTWNLRGYVTTAAGQIASLPLEEQKDKYKINNTKSILAISGDGSSNNADLIESETNRSLTHFNIYRKYGWNDDNYELIGSVPAIIGINHYSYYDESFIGEFIYQVTACNYGAPDECESEPGTALLNPNEDFVYVFVTEINENEAGLTRMYPNPANESLTIESADISRVTMMNALGQLVYDATTNNASKVVLNTVTYEAGVYVVRVQTSEGSVSKRLTIVR
jgi:hypothetical protein